MIIRGDARSIPLADETVQTVVTSPPYWGLRAYSALPESIWGGEADCEHSWGASVCRMLQTGGINEKQLTHRGNNGSGFMTTDGCCQRCGAWRGHYGLEPRLEDYIAHTVEIFREVRRVLKPDGCVFLNLGDCYAHGILGGGSVFDNGRNDGSKFYEANKPRGREKISTLGAGLKPKDLCGVPWRVAFALQADGWWLRSDIIWNKPNPMPESVQGSHWERHQIEDENGNLMDCPGCPKCAANDGYILCMSAGRPTRSHEYIFLLTKQGSYFYDSTAIQEPSTTCDIRRPYTSKGAWQLDGRPESQRHGGEPRDTNGLTRNKRSVWTIPSQPLGESHYAAYPEALVMPCILAGTSAKGECSRCGNNWVRVTDSSPTKPYKSGNLTNGKAANWKRSSHCATGDNADWQRPQTIGWKPTCSCNAPIRPNLVLDPFSGSGTTLLVAERLGRRNVGLELSPDYIEISRRRTAQMGLFA